MFPEITSALWKRMRSVEGYSFGEERAPCSIALSSGAQLLTLAAPRALQPGSLHWDFHFHTETFHVFMRFIDEQMKDHGNCPNLA